MSLNDPLSNVLSVIDTADKKGRKTITLKNASKVIIQVLEKMKDAKYLGDVTFIKDGKSGKLEVNLLGSINQVGVIKPRHSVKVSDYKKFEERYLPAFGFGYLIVSTTKGIMTQEEATSQNLGGKLLAYVY